MSKTNEELRAIAQEEFQRALHRKVGIGRHLEGPYAEAHWSAAAAHWVLVMIELERDATTGRHGAVLGDGRPLILREDDDPLTLLARHRDVLPKVVRLARHAMGIDSRASLEKELSRCGFDDLGSEVER